MLSRKSAAEKLRLLSAGCATGEEPYSLAIALVGRYGVSQARDRFRLIGVDIDRLALDTARKGVYGRGAFRRLDPALLERYFEPADEGRRAIRSEIRNLVDFKRRNLLETPYPDDLSAMDVVFYRNVSIYFEPEARLRIFQTLSEILVPDGCLVVSATETLSHDFHLLSLVEKDGVFFYEKKTDGPSLPSVSRPPNRKRAPSATAPPRTFEQRGMPVPAEPPAPTQPPKPENARYAEAMDLAAAKSYDAALTAIDRLMAEAPDFLPAKTLKAALLLNRGADRRDEARQLCEAALVRDPWCIEALLLTGILDHDRHDPETAAQRFRTVVYHQTDNWLAHFYLAEIFKAKGQTEAARRECAIVVRLLEKGRFPRHGLPFFHLAFSEGEIIHLCRENLRRALR